MKPRFLFPVRARAGPNRRLIKVNTRGSTYFAEVAFAAGPPTEGETGENDVGVMFGDEWMLTLWNDWVLELYKWNGSAWERRNPLDHPLFGEGVTVEEGARHITMCFDQSARVIIAYEIGSTVKVTRWDGPNQQYIQNVSFTGHDPVLFMDALVAHPDTWPAEEKALYDAGVGFILEWLPDSSWRENVITDSDVVIFYLDSSREEVRARVQRQLYATEHALHNYGEARRLDQQAELFSRYQLLLGDEAGAAEAEALTISDYIGELMPFFEDSDELPSQVAPEDLVAEQTTYLEEAEEELAGGVEPEALAVVGDLYAYPAEEALPSEVAPEDLVAVSTVYAEVLEEGLPSEVEPEDLVNSVDTVPAEDSDELTGGITVESIRVQATA